MKTEIINQEDKTEWNFPCLGKHLHSGLVVLFTKNQYGTVIVRGRHSGVGEYSEDWDMSQFTPLKGETIIKFTK